jgi:hypothetical protein
MNTPVKLNQKSYFTRKTFTIPAGMTVVANITGSTFSCKSATGVFYLSYDDSEEFPMETGLGFKLAAGDGFSRLALRNPGTVDNTVTFYAGHGDINLLIVEQRLPSTRLVPYTGAINNGAYKECVGTNLGNRRKQIVVTNLDAASDLELRDAAGTTIFDKVFPRSKWTVETDATIRVYNTSGAAVTVAIGEFFYNS